MTASVGLRKLVKYEANMLATQRPGQLYNGTPGFNGWPPGRKPYTRIHNTTMTLNTRLQVTKVSSLHSAAVEDKENLGEDVWECEKEKKPKRKGKNCLGLSSAPKPLPQTGPGVWL